MSDAYGTIVVAWQDCEPNKAAIADFLSNYYFSNEGDTIDDDLRFRDRMQYPTLRPNLDAETFHYCGDDGKFTQISVAEAEEIVKTFDDYCEGDPPECYLDIASYTTLSLEDWSALAVHLGGTGFIEFCSVQNEKMRYVQYERVRVYHSGEVDYEFRCSGPVVYAATVNERLAKGVYFPTTPTGLLPTPQ